MKLILTKPDDSLLSLKHEETHNHMKKLIYDAVQRAIQTRYARPFIRLQIDVTEIRRTLFTRRHSVLTPG